MSTIIMNAAANVANKTVDNAASVAKKALDNVAAGVATVYIDGTNFVSNLPSGAGKVIAAVEAVPLKMAAKVDEYQKTAASLVGVQGKIESIIGNLVTIATTAITKNGPKLQESLNEGAKGVVGSASNAALSGVYGLPVVGQLASAAVGTASTGAAALKSANNVLGVGTQIMNQIVEDATKESGAPQHSVAAALGSKTGGQTGGAKTRRHLKKMIRQRHLIQTRTNKMIHEFMNPIHPKTMNKKYFSKKSKRRRRR
jgi:hypothetical protein